MRLSHFFKIAIVTSFLVVVHLSILSTCLAQVDDGMLIFKVDGNRYTRKNFNKSGKLKSYQTIEIGKINASYKKIETKMTVITFDADGTLKDTSQTSLVCTPESKQVLMGIFPFAGSKGNKSLVVKMDEGAIMYPSGWKKLSELKDFNLSLNFKGGAVGFFGTKSSVSITNRKVMPLESIFGVSGNLTMKVYVLGIKISEIKYDFYEEIDEQKGIVRQKFTGDNGNYFTVEIEK